MTQLECASLWVGDNRHSKSKSFNEKLEDFSSKWVRKGMYAVWMVALEISDDAKKDVF